MKQLLFFLSCFFMFAQVALSQRYYYTHHPENKEVCPGASHATFSATVNTGNVRSIQWYYRIREDAEWILVNRQVQRENDWSCDTRDFSTSKLVLKRGATIAMNGYQFRVKLTAGVRGDSEDITSNAGTLTVACDPICITINPVAQSTCLGGEAVFSVEVSSRCRTVGYEWWVGKAGADGIISSSDIRKITDEETPGYSGFTTGRLKIENVTAEQNGLRYRCLLKVANPIDGDNKNSQWATLTVNSPPQITHPSGASVCAGTAADFAVAVGGAEVTDYQWQQRTDDDSEWDNISKEESTPKYGYYTTAHLKVKDIPRGHNGYQYRCRLTIANCGTIFSHPATLTVSRPPDITHPIEKNICPGGETTFEIMADSEVTAFQWQQRADDAADWTNITGTETSPTYKDPATPSLKVANAEAGHNNYQYRCQLTAGCGTFASDPAVLTVNSLPEITHPVAKSVCPGAEAEFQVSAEDSDITAYQWQQRTHATAAWVTISESGNSPEYSDFTTGHLKINAITSAHTGYEYRCQLTGTLCNMINSNPAALTVTQPVVAPLADRNICPGHEASFKISVTHSDCITSYKWQQRTSAAAAWADISGAETSPKYSGHTTDQLKVNDISATHNGYQYRCRLILASVTQDIEPASLFVNPSLEIVSHPKDSTVRERNPQAAFRIEAKGIRLSYQWQVSHDQEKTWADIRAIGSGSGHEDKPWEKEELQVNDIPHLITGYRYRCLVSATSCSGLASKKISKAAKLVWEVSATRDRSPGREVTLQVYPNPAHHRVNIRLWHAAQGKTISALYNITGQKVWSDYAMKNGETLTKEIQVGHLPNGLYLLKMVVGSEAPVQTKVAVAH